MTKQAHVKPAQAINPRAILVDRIRANFPPELIALQQWVVWELEQRGESTTKVPYQANGIKAGSTNSATWSDFEKITTAYLKSSSFSGIGFVFTNEDPYVGIDLDKCRDPVSGVIEPWAVDVLARIDTYTELSPSGTGFHLLGKGKLPHSGRKKKQVEMYESGRYFTVTGDHYGQSPNNTADIQACMTALHSEFFDLRGKKSKKKLAAPTLPTVSTNKSSQALDHAVVAAILASNDAHHFGEFQVGNWSGLGYPSQSEGDLALTGMLARHAGAYPETIDRLFRSTGMMRDKWDELRGASTYGEMTICKVLDSAAANEEAQAFVARMNERYAVIQNNSQVKILVEGQNNIKFGLLSKSDFDLLICNMPSPQSKVSPANFWLRSLDRRKYDGLVFQPVKEAPGKYNMWRGFSVSPKPGQCSVFWQFVREGICAGSDEIYAYLRRYFAHMIQFPWERPEVAIVMRGGQGTGKNTFSDAMGSLVKLHFCEITSVDQLTGRFNAHMRNVLLLHANEATWGGNKSESGKLKALITDATIPIEMKGHDIIHIDNYLRLVISSNDAWPVPVDADDRRFLLLDVSPVFKQDKVFFGALHAELNAGGREALMYDLQSEDLTGFSPRAKPNTPFGADMKIRSADSPTRWMFEALSANAWPHNGMPMFTGGSGVIVAKLRRAVHDDYEQWCRRTTERHPVPRDLFFKRVRELLSSSISDSRPSGPVGQTRPRELVFTSIEGCRQAFAVSMGIVGSVVWDFI